METNEATYPWAALPPALAEVLRPELAATRDEIIAVIVSEVPAYSGALAGRMGTTVRRGVDVALGRLLALFGVSEPALDEGASNLYQRIGALESREGRSLEALLSAYRIGSRVAWQHFARRARIDGVGPDQLVALAESLFVYIDELSAASADGHAAESAAAAGFRDVVKSRLAQALIDGEAASDPVAVSELSDAADWAMPQRMAVALVPLPAGGDARLRLAPPGVLVLERPPDLVAILPDPSGPGRRRQLTAAWGSQTVYVGTVRPPAEAPVSLAHAVRIRRLAAQGEVPSYGVVAAADHLPELVVAADEPLLAEMRQRVLSPLADLPPGKRDVLERTLREWLAQQGDRTAVAQRLVVHPQTVSYRMARVQELFGAVLQEPRGRWALQLALGIPRGDGPA